MPSGDQSRSSLIFRFREVLLDKGVSKRLNQHLAAIREECSFATGCPALTLWDTAYINRLYILYLFI